MEPHVALVLVVFVALVALVARRLAHMIRALGHALEILFALVAEQMQVDSLLVKPDVLKGLSIQNYYN